MYKENIENLIKTYCDFNKITINKLECTVKESDSHWFSNIHFYLSSSLGNINFCVDGLRTGCGSILMYGFTSSDINEKTAPIVDLFFKYCAKDGRGTCFTICGDNSKSASNCLKYWGFIQLYEYPNLMHQTGHKQRIYQKTSTR